ncbi:MAG: hypothetical protein M9894_01720 [Planctomycetes bacterium]|nr:hypothetical protein [Planctomycetota bacterium]
MNPSSVVSVVLVLGAGLALAGCGPSSRAAAAVPGGPGAAAAALVGPHVHRALRVEVDYVEGRRPGDDALERLRQRLLERTDHPGGVEVVLDDVLAPTGRERHTLDDVRALARLHRDPEAGDAGVIHVLVLDGEADPALGHHLLGAAFGPTSVVVFPDAVLRAVGGSTTRAADLLRWTLIHEAGHLLGLVNLGAPQAVPHEDLAKRGHCDQPGCVMRWSGDERVTDFCPRCKDDLRALGGR